MTFVISEKLRDVFEGCVYVETDNRILIPDGRLLSRAEFNVRFGGMVFCMDVENDKVTTDAWQAFLFNQVVRMPRIEKAPGVVTIQDARRAGAMTYRTARPCRRGHVGERYVSTGNCVDCLRENAQDKAVINQSVRRLQRAKKIGNPQMFVVSLPLEYHERFNQLQQAYLHGSPDWLRDLDSAIEAMLSQGADQVTGKAFA